MSSTARSKSGAACFRVLHMPRVRSNHRALKTSVTQAQDGHAPLAAGRKENQHDAQFRITFPIAITVWFSARSTITVLTHGPAEWSRPRALVAGITQQYQQSCCFAFIK